MKFKKVEITKENSTDITVLENVKLWFTGGISDEKITLFVGDFTFTDLKIRNAFFIPDNMIEFKSKYDSKEVFTIKAYL